MGLYGRSDVMSVCVPLTAGGCGVTHSRPVIAGVTEEEWNLEGVCVVCAASLRGDPLWAAMPAEIPETPDERTKREDAEKRGEKALKKAQEQTNVKLAEVSEQIVQLLKAQHNGILPGQDGIAEIVAAEVAKALAQQTVYTMTQDSPGLGDFSPVLESAGEQQLSRLHVRTLGKMCRERGLDSTGGKTDLIARLITYPAIPDEVAAGGF
jgi:hypothetical protein